MYIHPVLLPIHRVNVYTASDVAALRFIKLVPYLSFFLFFRCDPQCLLSLSVSFCLVFFFSCSRLASLRAVRLPVHLPASLHSRILRLRHLGTDKTSDDLFYFRRQQANQNVLFIAQYATHRDSRLFSPFSGKFYSQITISHLSILIYKFTYLSTLVYLTIYLYNLS